MIECRVELGKYPEDTKVWVGDAELVEKGIVSGINVTVRPGRMTQVTLELIGLSCFGETGIVDVDHQWLRDLASSQGFELRAVNCNGEQQCL